MQVPCATHCQHLVGVERYFWREPAMASHRTIGIASPEISLVGKRLVFFN